MSVAQSPRTLAQPVPPVLLDAVVLDFDPEHPARASAITQPI
jgi:hypothetical protein